MVKMRPVTRLFLAAAVILCACRGAKAYAVIAHEAIIDAAWNGNILPLLMKRFPNATAEQVRQAQAFAYGGAIIQDMGYYPFGNKLFSNLTHYVRSGDFVLNLLSEAHDIDEYAFALGALSHYVADSNGHPEATNRVVPLMYPKLQKKFGAVVTYEDSPASHLKVEFSFDVVQVAQGDYAPQAYHDHIGFAVAQGVLARAFAKTYSIPVSDLFFDEDLAIDTYRFAVSSVIPSMTKVAWSLKKDEIRRARPGMTRKKFLYNLSKSDYRKSWGTHHRGPGPGARFLAFLIRILPKAGPLQALTFPTPPRMAETLFMRSFNETLSEYRKLLKAYDEGHLRLPNDNFDTGGPERAGTYRLEDQTYADLLDRVSGQPIAADLRANILAFYDGAEASDTKSRKKRKQWRKVMTEVSALRTGKPQMHTP
jgi:hypothetical protein